LTRQLKALLRQPKRRTPGKRWSVKDRAFMKEQYGPRILELYDQAVREEEGDDGE
jgi:hypothetical protein